MECLEETHAMVRSAGIDENPVPLHLAMKGKTDRYQAGGVVGRGLGSFFVAAGNPT